MKTRIFLFLLLGLFFLPTAADAQLRKMDYIPFKKGEKLKYKAYYDSYVTGHVNAGEGIFEIKKNSREIAGRQCMHVVANWYTLGAFNLFFKVRDRYESFIDEEAIVPWLHIRRVKEGGYTVSQDVTFNHYNNTTHFKNNKNGQTNVQSVPPNVQDIISVLYYARCWDVSNVKIGDFIPLQFTLDDTVFTTNMYYRGKETIKTSAGTFKCLVIKPQVLMGNVFDNEFPMTLWVTDDKNHIPVMGQSEVIVGVVKMELLEYSGLKYPLTSKVK